MTSPAAEKIRDRLNESTIIQAADAVQLILTGAIAQIELRFDGHTRSGEPAISDKDAAALSGTVARLGLAIIEIVQRETECDL